MLENDFVEKIRIDFKRVADQFRDGLEVGLEEGAQHIIHGTPRDFWIRASYINSLPNKEDERLRVECTYTNATVFKRDIICNPIDFEELDEILNLFVENGPVIYFRHFQQVLSFLLESDILPDDLNGLMNSLVISKVMST
jgi:hypothetical protein